MCTRAHRVHGGLGVLIVGLNITTLSERGSRASYMGTPEPRIQYTTTSTLSGGDTGLTQQLFSSTSS